MSRIHIFSSLMPALLFFQDLSAQEGSGDAFIDSVSKCLIQQVVQYPQEKLHLHTDKPNYLTGEKIWFRAHLVDALFHKQANASRYVYVELANPLDSIISRVKIRPDSMGFFHGYIPVREGIAEGNYTLRAYTMYMKNLGEEYFFRKSIPVIDPLSVNFEIESSMAVEGKTETLYFTFIEKRTRQVFQPQTLTAKLDGQKPQRLKFQNDSAASFSFSRPDKGGPGIITLKFDYQGKIFSKYVTVSSPGQMYDVTFHPEGGNFLAGTDNALAFKCIDYGGLSKDISGRIMDEDGNLVTEFRTEHLGMGSLNIKPLSGMKYHAVCMDDRGNQVRFELPAPLDDYVSLRLTQDAEALFVAVNRSGKLNPDSKLYLLGLFRGLPFYLSAWDHTPEPVRFDKEQIPSGVCQFILIDGGRNILSERLYFSHNEKEGPRVEYTTRKPSYAPRERIISSVKVTDTGGRPVSGNFSVAVTDDNDVTPDTTATIVSTLLLASELKGHIESPASYLDRSDPMSAMKADLLMMTQGWKRYPISEVIRGKPASPQVPPETSQVISGRADGLFGAVKEGVISILAMDGDLSNAHLAETDDNGRFELRDFEYRDSTRFIVQARTKKDRGNVSVEIDDDKVRYPGISFRLPLREMGRVPDNYILKADRKYVFENGMRVVDIDQVTVTGQRKEASQSRYYSPLSGEGIITEEDIDKLNISTMQSLLSRLPGVFVSGGVVQVRGAEPLIVIDDIAYEGFDLLSMNIDDIGDIFVMRDAVAGVMFGSAAVNGAIVVSTKRGFVGKNLKRINISDLVLPLGYQQPAEFYSPKYDRPQNDMPSDLRTTIYWKPLVKITETGEAALDFYSADSHTTYSVVIEGISDEGHLIRKVATIVVGSI